MKKQPRKENLTTIDMVADQLARLFIEQALWKRNEELKKVAKGKQTKKDRVKQFIRSNEAEVSQYGQMIKETIHDLLDKYSGEENLSPQVFMLPNMYAKKEAVQAAYINGLLGFLGFMKDKIYSQFNQE